MVVTEFQNSLLRRLWEITQIKKIMSSVWSGRDQIVILNVLMKEAEAVAITLGYLSTHRFQQSGQGILVLGKCFQWSQLRFGCHIWLILSAYILKNFLFPSIVSAIRIPENAWETNNGNTIQNKKRDKYAAKTQNSMKSNPPQKKIDSE